MGFGLTVLFKTAVMFILIVVGIICWKTKLINKASIDGLINIVTKFVIPAQIIMAFQMPREESIMEGIGYSFLFSAISFAVTIAVVYLVIRKKKNPNFRVDRLSAIYSNCGFFGIPVIQGLFGAEGVAYLTAFIAVFNILLWTHGLSLISGEGISKSTLKKIISTPTVFATIIAMVMFFTGFTLPGLAAEPLDMLSALQTPLPMIIAGATIAQAGLLSALKKPTLWLTSAMRLIVLPLITFGVLIAIFGTAAPMPLNIVFLAAGCPVGTMCTLLAIDYKQDGLYASQLFAVTTLLACITLPLLGMMLIV